MLLGKGKTCPAQQKHIDYQQPPPCSGLPPSGWIDQTHQECLHPITCCLSGGVNEGLSFLEGGSLGVLPLRTAAKSPSSHTSHPSTFPVPAAIVKSSIPFRNESHKDICYYCPLLLIPLPLSAVDRITSPCRAGSRHD